MNDKKIYIVAKVFDKPGSLAYLCKTPNEARCLPGTLEALRAEGVQIVILDSPEIYSEYAPYSYVEDMKAFIVIRLVSSSMSSLLIILVSPHKLIYSISSG